MFVLSSFLNGLGAIIMLQLPRSKIKSLGVIEIRDASHIALLFAEEACQGKGGALSCKPPCSAR